MVEVVQLILLPADMEEVINNNPVAAAGSNFNVRTKQPEELRSPIASNTRLNNHRLPRRVKLGILVGAWIWAEHGLNLTGCTFVYFWRILGPAN